MSTAAAHACRGAGEPAALVVVLHDVAPSKRAEIDALRRAVRSVGAIPVTQLVVPRFHGEPADASFDRWLDDALAGGDELALHGYTHADDGEPRNRLDRMRRRWYTAGEGEFAGLDQAQATRRLDAGREWFERRRWPLHGFVAPAWLMSAGTWAALHEQPFRYTCTLSSVFDLEAHRHLRSQSIVYSTRAAWRRALSLPWNAAVASFQRSAPLLRFELHPGDVVHGTIRSAWMRLLERALADGRHPLTMAQAADSSQRGREWVPRVGEGAGARAG